jgi:MAF protein
MIYLASTSPRRRRLLQKAGSTFRILRPCYEEDQHLKGRPSRVVQAHALGKAMSCVERVKNGTLIAADTIVYLEGKIIGKPKHMEEAGRILRRLQGRWHWVYTGVAVFEIASGQVSKKTIFFEKTKVRIKRLNKSQLDHYLKTINPLDKAGAYAIQSPNENIVREVRGLFSNAIGLPIERVLKKREGGL